MTTMNDTEIPRPTKRSKLHLYVAQGCPFCHRVLATLALSGLGPRVTCTWMRNVKRPIGWEIAAGDDPLFGVTQLKNVYERLEPGVASTPSVPLLVDLSSNVLLSANSARITRFFARGMNGACPVARDLSPVELVGQIDSMNQWLHDHVNRAVYRVGFAAAQAHYDTRVARLFESLDALEAHLVTQPYLLGDMPTKSDLFLFATLVRFDSVYHPLFKCSYRRIADYSALFDYLKRLHGIDGLAGSYDHALIKEHYFLSVMHVDGEVRDLNPSRLIPIDPWNQGQAPTVKTQLAQPAERVARPADSRPTAESSFDRNSKTAVERDSD